MMKILGGSLKGRNIKTPNTPSTRPVTSLLRKSLFDTCQFFIGNARVLDLFAGSGAIGIEALSRGAALAYFIDNSTIAMQCIKENITSLALQQHAYLLKQDAFLFLTTYDKEPFHILFIDPPYLIGLPGYLNLIDLLRKTKALSVQSHIFLEAPSQLEEPLTLYLKSLFTIKKTRKNSTTLLLYLVPFTDFC